MPINFKSLLSSAVANATFFDKTIDDTTIGKVTLSNIDPLSGSSIGNTQREINLSKRLIFNEDTKIDGDTIILDIISMDQEHRLIGDGAITMNSLPFGAVKIVEDGSQIILVGHSNVNTIKFTLNDVDYGLYINGDATLKRGYALTLRYNDELKRYYEIGRNF